jgi:hypothetical protein
MSARGNATALKTSRDALILNMIANRLFGNHRSKLSNSLSFLVLAGYKALTMAVSTAVL